MNTKKRLNRKAKSQTRKRTRKPSIKHHGGSIPEYKYKTLPFGKVSNITVSKDIKNRISKSFGITKNPLDSFLQVHKDRIYTLDKLSEVKEKYLAKISKFQLVDIIYNPNKKLEFVYNHSIGKPETITAGKPGYHIYVFIIPGTKNNGKQHIKYELMGIVTNLSN
jgi:hypothetical protein